MRILVTGGAGYVGSHCVRRLLDAGHAVTVIDNLSQGHRAALDPRAAFVEADLADAEALSSATPKDRFDAVMHFAALLNVGESVQMPLRYYRNNIANTINLLEAMQRAGITRLVFSSTAAVYGVPERIPIVEDVPKRPINPYGATKLAVEWLLRDSAAAWGLGSIALRYFNACGAAADGKLGEDHRPETHLIPNVLAVPLGRRSSVQVFGRDYPTPDGSCVRDYIHVEDLAEAHLCAIENLQPAVAEAFNVGTSRGYSVLEIVEAARKVTDHPIPIDAAPRRAGDPPTLLADSSKLQRRFGWRPRYTDVTEIVRTAWAWHAAHPDGYPS